MYPYISLHINHAQPLAHIKAQHNHIGMQELPVYRACGVIKLKSKQTIAKLYIINERLVAITKRRNVSVGLLPRGALAYPPGICLAWIDHNQFKTYEKNVDVPHPASPRNRIETTGESGSESAIEWWLNSERRTDVQIHRYLIDKPGPEVGPESTEFRDSAINVSLRVSPKKVFGYDSETQLTPRPPEALR